MFSYMISMSLVIFLSAVSGCNELTKVKIVGSSQAAPDPSLDASLIFGGLTSISGKSDSLVTLHWTTHADATSYEILNIVGGVPVLLATAIGQATAQYQFTGLTPSAYFLFRVRMKNAALKYDGNTNNIAVTMNAAPDVPSALAIQSPYSPSTSATPTIRVSGVKNGDTVEIFSNGTCTASLGSGTAAGSTIDIITSSLAVGTYTIYAKATNSVPTSSACSSSVSYERYQCPSNYLSVPFNSAVGTSADFCVAKYEMKDVGTVATSQTGSAPWANINRSGAITACTNLGVKYFLITNPEWMTIARNIESVNANWSSGTSGTGYLFIGHSDGNPGFTLDASTDNDGYFSTGNAVTNPDWGGKEQRRTLTLSNGEVIWDFAGNVWEWINWSVTPAEKAYVTVDGAPVLAWRDFKNLSEKIGLTDEMIPSTWQAALTTLDAGTNGIGSYISGDNISGGPAIRGGAIFEGVNSGVYALALDNAAILTNAGLGFRCVYRP